ncbi:M6 family metalloprotease domain-containing protein [Streptomyces lycii]|uniref:M6 family metalloprotease domain-containing protein n=1 Tax=Streptomyces lycii TaxID=2654337 RepID=A0ABQ7FLP9_9ACTN|nr:M6 family metalloprotease domain-containing protein [Streptomyces lycii]KAF4409755.1 M6 family metalloprotease domain-containing protein [Streptomyces lycii]
MQQPQQPSRRITRLRTTRGTRRSAPGAGRPERHDRRAAGHGGRAISGGGRTGRAARRPGTALLTGSALAAAVISVAAAPAVPVAHPGPAAEVLARPDATCAPVHAPGVQMSEGIPTPSGHAPTTGTLRALTLMIDFPDAQGEGRALDRFAEFFPETADWYERSSYGVLDYRAETPVRDWLRMPRPFASYGVERGARYEPGYRRLVQDLARAADRHVDFSAYDLINVLVTPNAGPSAVDTVLSVTFTGPPGVPHADGVPLDNMSFIYSRQDDGTTGAAENAYRVLPHENAHSLGLPDLYTGEGGRKAGHWDLMSEGWGANNDFLGWHKRKLGWLDEDREVGCAVGSGTSEHTLLPLNRRTDAGASGPGASAAPAHPAGHPAAHPTSKPASEPRPRPGSRTGSGSDSRPGPGSRSDARSDSRPGSGSRPGPGARPGTGTGAGRGTKLLYVPVTGTAGYAVEVRTREGNDAVVCKPGVLVYWVDTRVDSGAGPVEVRDSAPRSGGCAQRSNVNAELTDAPFGVGETYRDARTGITVEVTGRNADGSHELKVSRP